ncbi:MAG TPA: hypothetical protein VJI33_02175 [Candidatus Paceibacterota bacterium]
MNERVEKRENVNGWQDETALRADAFAAFLKKYSEDEQLESETKRHYDHLVEFHTSGAGLKPEMRKGEIKPSNVKVYYEGSEIKKMHIVYGPKSETDVILSGRALADFLKE